MTLDFPVDRAFLEFKSKMAGDFGFLIFSSSIDAFP